MVYPELVPSTGLQTCMTAVLQPWNHCTDRRDAAPLPTALPETPPLLRWVRQQFIFPPLLPPTPLAFTANCWVFCKSLLWHMNRYQMWILDVSAVGNNYKSTTGSAVGGRINIWWLYFKPSSPSCNHIHNLWVIQPPFVTNFSRSPLLHRALFTVTAALFCKQCC